jgi:hypothetical protein
MTTMSRWLDEMRAVRARQKTAVDKCLAALAGLDDHDRMIVKDRLRDLFDVEDGELDQSEISDWDEPIEEPTFAARLLLNQINDGLETSRRRVCPTCGHTPSFAYHDGALWLYCRVDKLKQRLMERPGVEDGGLPTGMSLEECRETEFGALYEKEG